MKGIMPERTWREIVVSGPLVCTLARSAVHTIEQKLVFIRAYSRADAVKLTESICAFVLSTCAGFTFGGKD